MGNLPKRFQVQGSTFNVVSFPGTPLNVERGTLNCVLSPRAPASRDIAAPDGAETHLAINVEPPFEAAVGTGAVTTPLLERIAQAAVAYSGLQQPVEVALTLAGDETLRRLNRGFRGIDRPTDVLSFAQTEPSTQPFVTPPGVIVHLGDVIISYPRAVAQAAEYGHSLERELGYLFVHGLLHLLGYDHDDEREYARMRRAEEDILKRVDLGRPKGREELPE